MTSAIIGTGTVGRTLAGFFQKAGIEVALANTRGAEAVEPIAKELGGKVIATSLDDALRADVIFFAVQFLNVKDVASVKPDWTGRLDRLMAGLEWMLFGRRTVADAYLYVMCGWKDRSPTPLASYPALAAFKARLDADEGVQRGLAGEPSD